MFLLDGDAFREFQLVLVIVDGFSVDLDGQLLLGRGLKESWHIIGDAHEIDGGRALVDEGHGRLNLLRAVRPQIACGVSLLNLGFKNFEFLFLERHASFRGLHGLREHRVGQIVGEIRLGLSHHGSLFGFPLAVWRDVLVNVVDVKEKFLASFHADLKFGQINGEGRTVLKDGLTNPVVRSLVFTNSHVSEPTAEGIQFAERHVRNGGVCTVRGGGFPSLDGLGRFNVDGSLKADGLRFAGLQTSNGPRDDAVIKFGATGHFKVHL